MIWGNERSISGSSPGTSDNVNVTVVGADRSSDAPAFASAAAPSSGKKKADLPLLPPAPAIDMNMDMELELEGQDGDDDDLSGFFPAVIPGELVPQISMGSISSAHSLGMNSLMNVLQLNTDEDSTVNSSPTRPQVRKTLPVNFGGTLMETAAYLSSVIEDRQMRFAAAPPPPPSPQENPSAQAYPVFHPLRTAPAIEDILQSDDLEDDDLLFDDAIATGTVPPPPPPLAARQHSLMMDGDESFEDSLLLTHEDCPSPVGVMDFFKEEHLQSSSSRKKLPPKDLFSEPFDEGKGDEVKKDDSLILSASRPEPSVTPNENMFEPIPTVIAITPPTSRERKMTPAAPRKVSLLQRDLQSSEGADEDQGILLSPSVQKKLVQLFDNASEDELDNHATGLGKIKKNDPVAKDTDRTDHVDMKDGASEGSLMDEPRATAPTELVIEDKPLGYSGNTMKEQPKDAVKQVESEGKVSELTCVVPEKEESGAQAQVKQKRSAPVVLRYSARVKAMEKIKQQEEQDKAVVAAALTTLASPLRSAPAPTRGKRKALEEPDDSSARKKKNVKAPTRAPSQSGVKTIVDKEKEEPDPELVSVPPRYSLSNAQQWSIMYQRAKEFAEKNGHCRIPTILAGQKDL